MYQTNLHANQELEVDADARISLATIPICLNVHLFGFPRCQGSSVVEQGTHKPLVGSSTLPPGTLESPRSEGRCFRLRQVLRGDLTGEEGYVGQVRRPETAR
jgi:hypothetical protein